MDRWMDGWMDRQIFVLKFLTQHTGIEGFRHTLFHFLKIGLFADDYPKAFVHLVRVIDDQIRQTVQKGHFPSYSDRRKQCANCR